MNKFKLILIGAISVIAVACAPTKYLEKTSEATSQGFYAISDSFNAGRFDLLGSYIQYESKLIPQPKKRINIKHIIDKAGNDYLILPGQFKNTPMVVVGSTQFTELLKYKEIATEYKKDQDTLKSYDAESAAQAVINENITNQLILDNQKDKIELTKYHDSLEYKIKSFFTGFKWFSIAGIIGLIAACIFVPALIPILLNIAGVVCGLVARVFNVIVEILSKLFSSTTTQKV